MNVISIGYKNLKASGFRSILTLIMLAAGVALAVLLSALNESVDQGFKKNIKGTDMVVGAKGSPLQLILSAIYQIDNPTGNISKAEADQLAKNRLIDRTVQLSFGDSYKGRKIIGTSPEYMDWYGAELRDGRAWSKPFEAVVGAQVAVETGLKIGSTFHSAHGSDIDAEVHDHIDFKVVGIMEHSSTILDRVILVSDQSIRDLHHSEPGAEEEITAMLVRFKNKMGMLSLPRLVNEQTSMQAALPAIEVNRLMGLFSVGRQVFEIVTILLLALGGISVLVSMISAMSDRAYELALIRAMGAGRSKLLVMILTEAALLGLFGAIFGIIFGHVAQALLKEQMMMKYGFELNPLQFTGFEIALLLGTVLICVFAALFPALSASRRDVFKTLKEYED